ncbi:MAG: DNA replication/repair protein RecF [Candidatus Izemoplasmataceae bacterium]
MIVKELTLNHFRLIDHSTFRFHPQMNIIIGDNAQGKTTVLEAIHLLGLTKSHRLAKDEDMIQTDAEFAKIHALCHFNQTDNNLSMVISKSGKKAKINDLEMTKLSDYIGRLHVVMFSPEDIDLIKGSPLERRRFLDLAISQLSNQYVQYLLKYRKLLKERNDILKGLDQNKFDLVMLDVITDQMIHYAEKIVIKRKKFLDDLNPILEKYIRVISEDDPITTLLYDPSVEQHFKQMYEKKKSIDMMLKSTSLGPHRDDCLFYAQAKQVKTIASQGQLRTIVLALKLSLSEMINAKYGHYPVVLLDDMFSELDHKRQQSILSKLNQKAQLFITTTDLSTIDETVLSQATLFTIEEGKIKGVKHYG